MKSKSEVVRMLEGQLYGGKGRIRLVTLETILKDSQEVVNLANDPGNPPGFQHFSFFTEPLSVERQLQYFFRMLESQTDIVMAIEAGFAELGRFIGTIGIHDIDEFNDKCRIGIIIFDRNYRKHGYGADALNTLLRFIFKKLKANKVYLTARADNKLAIKIYGKLGFKSEGPMRKEYKIRKGEYMDLLRMSILRDGYLSEEERSERLFEE